MAQFARGRLQRKIPEITAALEGHQMGAHHRFLIRQSLRHMEFLEQQIGEVDDQVVEKLQPYAEQYALLQTIPGLKAEGAACVLAELGPDMSVFPSASHAASWTGLAPGNNRSAGKQKSGRTTKGNRWLAGMLCQCAWAATRCKGSYFQAKYRRLLPRRGRQRALIAVAHSMLRVIYFVLSEGVPYREVGMTYLDQRRRRQQIRYHRRRLKELEAA
jgi:transposase